MKDDFSGKDKKTVSHFHQTPLTRPEQKEISVFSNHVKKIAGKKGKPKALVIGPSPEMRDVLSSHGIMSTVIAEDLEAIESAAEYMNESHKNENWLEGSIFGLPLNKSTFDIVLGDHIISDARPYNSKKFYGRLRKLLKKRGFAVLRSIVFGRNKKAHEKRIAEHFRIIEKEFGREGVFASHFPIYFMRPK